MWLWPVRMFDRLNHTRWSWLHRVLSFKGFSKTTSTVTHWYTWGGWSPVFSANLQELDETVKGMMESSENMIQVGKGQERAKNCKVCGMEGTYHYIRRHIESNHLEGVPCNLCDKKLRSRDALSKHVLRNYKEHWSTIYIRDYKCIETSTIVWSFFRGKTPFYTYCVFSSKKNCYLPSFMSA